jgi:hypothetical protein
MHAPFSSWERSHWAVTGLPVLRNLGHRGGEARSAWTFGSGLAESAGCAWSALPASHHAAMS